MQKIQITYIMHDYIHIIIHTIFLILDFTIGSAHLPQLDIQKNIIIQILLSHFKYGFVYHYSLYINLKCIKNIFTLLIVTLQLKHLKKYGIIHMSFEM